VLSPDPVSTNPPTIAQLSTATIGPETEKGTGTDQNRLSPGAGSGSGSPAPQINSNEPIDADDLDVMPEPVGGAAAWSKFLQKNIHYPPQAIDAGAQGKVWLTFIIERDGQLSNITVDHGAGHGLDDEALRVLKLAKAWKPGKQNGQPVRVKFSIPINFVMPEE
jgi:protein TonB